MNEATTGHWRKSSHSDHQGGDCVEVAALAPSPSLGVRDSKDPEGPKLVLTPAAWQALTHRIKNDKHNLA